MTRVRTIPTATPRSDFAAADDVVFGGVAGGGLGGFSGGWAAGRLVSDTAGGWWFLRRLGGWAAGF